MKFFVASIRGLAKLDFKFKWFFFGVLQYLQYGYVNQHFVLFSFTDADIDYNGGATTTIIMSETHRLFDDCWGQITYRSTNRTQSSNTSKFFFLNFLEAKKRKLNNKKTLKPRKSVDIVNSARCFDFWQDSYYKKKSLEKLLFF